MKQASLLITLSALLSLSSAQTTTVEKCKTHHDYHYKSDENGKTVTKHGLLKEEA